MSEEIEVSPHEEKKQRLIQLLRILAMGRPGASNELADMLMPEPDPEDEALPHEQFAETLVEQCLAGLTKSSLLVETVVEVVLERLQTYDQAAPAAAPAAAKTAKGKAKG